MMAALFRGDMDLKIEDDVLLRMYLEEIKSVQQISKETGVYTEWVSKRLKKLGVTVRNGNDSAYYGSRSKEKKPCCVCGKNPTIEYKKSGEYYCSRHVSQLDLYGKILDRTKFDKNEIHFVEDYVVIDLYDIHNNKNGECKLDLADLELVIGHKWVKDKQGYVITAIKDQDGKKHRTTMHRLLLCPKDEQLVDHVNQDKSDNRRFNIRTCTKSQNEINKPKRSNNTSGVKGVGRKGGKTGWYAELVLNGKKVVREYCDTFEEAVAIRKEAEIKYFGEFRYTGDD
jgi:hypothetical protein